MRLVFVLFAVAACQSSSSRPDSTLACLCDAPPSQCLGQRGGDCIGNAVCTYTSDGGRSDVCTCTSTGWRCNNCPADLFDTGATCTPGDSCSYEDWEHGCSCSCTGGGYWACSNDTIGSHCPTGIDAGV